MSSSQRSRAIAALAALVTLLAVGAVLSNVLTGPGGETAATGVGLNAPAVAANAQLKPSDQVAGPSGGQAPAPWSRRWQWTKLAKPQVTVPPSTSVTLPPSVPTTPAPAGQLATTAPTSKATSGSVSTGAPATATLPKPSPTEMPSSTPPKASVETTAPSSTTTTAKPTTASTAASSSTTAATQPPPATGGLTGVEAEVARMTNELRTNPNGPLARKKAQPSCVQVDGGGKVTAVPALTVSEAVSLNMSRPWSVDMNSRNTMDHRSQESALAIYTQLGISPRAYGENVAWFQGYSDAQAAQVLFEGWRESDGHYCNMMSASYTSFGVGVYKGSSRTWGTQNFYASR